MKWTAIVLNVLAAIGFFVLGSVAISIHRVHSYSTYREFVSVGAVDEQKLATIQQPANLPRSEHYDMPARMRQTGNAEFWFTCIANLAALACVINAIAIFFFAGGQNKTPESSKTGR
jgi:hypothetical protein